jgi:hypothetical protein
MTQNNERIFFNFFLTKSDLLVWDIQFDSVKDLALLKHQDGELETKGQIAEIARAGRSSLLVTVCRISYPTGD